MPRRKCLISFPNGGCSSVVEHWIVAPVVAVGCLNAKLYDIFQERSPMMIDGEKQKRVRSASASVDGGANMELCVGRWVHTCGGYTRWNADGTVDIFKTRAMGHTFTFEVMPEGFEPC